MPHESIKLREADGAKAGHRVLRLAGQLTLESLFPFQQAVRAQKASTLILDLTDVTFVDSAGVGALVGACVSYQRDGRKLALVGVSERVQGALSILSLGKFFPTFPNVEAAEDSLS
jgi:anti-sigma B factor antagonist